AETGRTRASPGSSRPRGMPRPPARPGRDAGADAESGVHEQHPASIGIGAAAHTAPAPSHGAHTNSREVPALCLSLVREPHALVPGSAWSGLSPLGRLPRMRPPVELRMAARLSQTVPEAFMRVSGFSFVRDAVRLSYPIAEAIRSILPICDEFVIAVGESQDGTLERIESIGD